MRFEGSGKTTAARAWQMTVKIGNETDSFEDVIRFEVLVSPETCRAYGEARDTAAVEKLAMPRESCPVLAF